MRNWERENFTGVDFCGIVTVLNCGLHNFWVKAVKTKPNIWAKRVIEWVKKKLENKIWDMSYKFELWDLSFKNWVLSHQQTKQALSNPKLSRNWLLGVPCRKGFSNWLYKYFIAANNIHREIEFIKISIVYFKL